MMIMIIRRGRKFVPTRVYILNMDEKIRSNEKWFLSIIFLVNPFRLKSEKSRDTEDE